MKYSVHIFAGIGVSCSRIIVPLSCNLQTGLFEYFAQLIGDSRQKQRSASYSIDSWARGSSLILWSSGQRPDFIFVCIEDGLLAASKVGMYLTR